MFMQMAEAASLRSTCFRRAVGAVLVHDNNVISIGYNGPPSGEPHCTGKNCPQTSVCVRAVHAEWNALSRQRATLYPVTMYTTESPCLRCAQRIVDERVRAVYYQHEYRVRDGIEWLISNGVELFRLTPSGYIINVKDGELLQRVQ